MTAMDAFAISMLAVVFTGFGVVALLFFNMARNARQRDPELEKLMHEALHCDGNDKSTTENQPQAREAWERDGDWWQKQA